MLGDDGTGGTWVILDVDRTICNTTSWYHACARPGPLLRAEQADRFRGLNEQAYGTPATISEDTFRRRTLDLLNEDPMSPARLYAGGVAVAAHLRLYPEVVAYLSHLRRSDDAGLRVVFLSAGYADFIAGVVDGLLRAHLLTGLRHQVVGSTLSYADGRARLERVVGGADKERFVREVLRGGGTVALLADDNFHDNAMFDAVTHGRGVALRIRHERDATSSRSWRDFLAEHHPHLLAEQELRTDGRAHALADTAAVQAEHAAALDNLPPAGNPIGVGELTVDQFAAALDELRAGCAAPAQAARLGELLESLMDFGGDRVRLRGRLFYLGAPPYLFPGPATRMERWQESVDVAGECLALLRATGVLATWDSRPPAVRWVVLAVLDHLKNAATLALDVLIRAGVGEAADDPLDAETEALVAGCHRAYWSTVFNRPSLNGMASPEAWRRLAAALRKQQPVAFPFRELDDPQVIMLSVLSVLSRLDSRPAGVLDFCSGALDLGLAFPAIAALLRPDEPPIEVAHMAFSSKNALRGMAVPARPSLSYLRSRMTAGHRERLAGWLRGDRPVLLYDNNVTTFGTLKLVKDALAEHGRAPVEAVVACVNYDNLRRARDGEPHEPLCADWDRVLDHPPVADYVTAFATWGTSVKTGQLDRLFRRPAAVPEMPPARPVPDRWFKVCRVHNLVDLAAVVRAGANAIGIHVVAPAEADDIVAQQRYRPLLPPNRVAADLPVPRFEVEAIRMMAKLLPPAVRPVIVVEQPVTPSDWRRILAVLELPGDCRLQLQCRVTAAEIDRQRAAVTGGLICAIGAEQHDLADYHAFLDAHLDPTEDLVLVDFSRHQPDLIGPAAGEHGVVPHDLDQIAAILRGGRVPVLLADDCAPAVLDDRRRRLLAAGAPIAGVDTQNSVEVAKTEQRYRLLGDDYGTQALVRKSPDLLSDWAAVLAG